MRTGINASADFSDRYYWEADFLILAHFHTDVSVLTLQQTPSDEKGHAIRTERSIDGGTRGVDSITIG